MALWPQAKAHAFPRQQLCQLHAPAIYMPQPSTCPCHLFFRPPRQQLLQLHAPAICFSGGSRLPFARPQTLQTLPQASKATTLTATCPCHLFFKGFKTAVCPPSNPPNASAGLQGNNSYSYMPLPSVFQWVQDCRLPALKPSKRFRNPPRQQLLQLHPPAICFSGVQDCCLPGLKPSKPFRRFKTAVCPPSNPPNASAGLQGNNSYSYMPLPSVFQRVQDCRLPALKPSKRFRRPPRQQLLQLHAPAICFSGGSRLPFARPQTFQTLPQASKATTLTATCPCHLYFSGFKTAVCPASNPPNPSAGLQGNNSYSYMPLPSVFQGFQDCRLPALKPSKRFRRHPRQQLLQLHAPALCFSAGSRLPFARPQTLQTLPQASKATTLTATCPCHLFFRGFKTAVCPPSNPPNASAGLQGNNSYSYMPLPSVFQRVQDCRLPALKPSKRFRKPPRQQLLQLHAPAICVSAGSRLPFARPLPSAFSGGSRLPFARPQTLQMLPQASKATTLTATCPCHLFFSGFKTAVCPASNPPNASAGLHGNNSYSYMPLPSVFQRVQDCRLPGLKPSKPFRRPPRQQLLQLHAPAICFSGGSRLPFARPQTLQTLPQASKATTLTATCPCPLFFSGFKTAVCPPSNLQTLPQASKATTLTATCPCHLCFSGFKTAVCPPSNPPNPSAGLQGNNSYSYMPLPSVFQRVQDCRLPALKPSKRFRRPPRQQTLTATCPCPLFFSGPSKRFRRPPRQQLLQLHAPAICISAGSRLPFARPQTLQTLPQASKAATLTATCPCHLLFQGVQDCRLPGLKPSKPFRRPPRQQLVQLHAPAICFSGGSRLPFARPQTLQTLPQASKATTLTATCPCSMPLPSVFLTATCPCLAGT